MFIAAPKIWDQRGYIRDTPNGVEYCLAGLAVALSGKAVKSNKYWIVEGHAQFHDTAQKLLDITDEQAEDIFGYTPWLEGWTAERFKQYVYQKLEIND